MNLIGAVVNFCSFTSANRALTAIVNCVNTGNKVMDKIVVPIGTFCISCYISDKTEEHIVGKVNEFKSQTKELRDLVKENNILKQRAEELRKEAEEKSEPIITNVFESAEEVD